jgi:hypothetical protein
MGVSKESGAPDSRRDVIDHEAAGRREVNMIRRNVIRHDQRVVRWSLVAAGLALSVGFYAQAGLESGEQAKAAAEKTAEAQATKAEDDTAGLVRVILPVLTKTTRTVTTAG